MNPIALPRRHLLASVLLLLVPGLPWADGRPGVQHDVVPGNELAPLPYHGAPPWAQQGTRQGVVSASHPAAAQARQRTRQPKLGRSTEWRRGAIDFGITITRSSGSITRSRFGSAAAAAVTRCHGQCGRAGLEETPKSEEKGEQRK